MRNLEIIASFLIGIVFGIIFVGTYQAHTQKPIEVPEPEIYYIESEPEIITETKIEYVYRDYPNVRELTERECDLLQQIAFAEAGNQGTKGMILVMNVVLNRVDADGYGNNVEDVIFASGQFYTAGMTPYVSDECKTALELVCDGVDLSDGALYFNTGGYRNGKEPVLQYKAHYFSK